MYIPDPFAAPDLAAALIERYAFATLVTVRDGLPVATHLPFLLAPGGPNGTLRGHMARANPQWRDFAPDTEVLVIFHGPHAYVSPNWYKTGPAVPTWNYAVAHAYGTPRLIESGEALAALLRDVVSAFDADPELAWLRGASKPRFLEGMMRQVVGFEIPIARMETKAKLSQNRPEADRAAVIGELARSNDTADRGVAEMMRDNDA